jgi:uncharacterized SAM-binding protein YcdF (DUF218 family)
MVSVLEAIVVPSHFCFLLIAAGLLLCIPRRTRKAAQVVLAAAGALLIVLSSGKTATLLLSPLEYMYPRVPDYAAAPARAIVVLAAYAANDPNMSLSARPNYSALYRINEAVLLWRRCPDCTVVVTGTSPTTNVMADLLIALGVSRDKVTVDSDASHTAGSAMNMRRVLGEAPFYLVTSGGHMPRAMAVFAKAGLHPIAAPTDHKLPKRVAQAAWALSPFHLECSDLAVHEHIGMMWYRMRGLI